MHSQTKFWLSPFCDKGQIPTMTWKLASIAYLTGHRTVFEEKTVRLVKYLRLEQLQAPFPEKHLPEGLVGKLAA